MSNFKELSVRFPRLWDAMLAQGQARTFEQGRMLFAEGAPAQLVYIVRSGLVELVKASVSGDSLRMAMVDEGTLFGEGALFASSTRSTTALAFRDTVVVEIAPDRLRNFLAMHHEFAALLYHMMSERLHQVVVDLDADLRTLHNQVHHQNHAGSMPRAPLAEVLPPEPPAPAGPAAVEPHPLRPHARRQPPRRMALVRSTAGLDPSR